MRLKRGRGSDFFFFLKTVFFIQAVKYIATLAGVWMASVCTCVCESAQ